MFQIILKTAWRSALRQKQFSLLNVLGLSIGITTCLLIGLYVKYELSYDNFHDQSDRIYRINQSSIWGDWKGQQATTGPNVAVALQAEIPEFEAVTRVLVPTPFAVLHKNQVNEVTSILQKRHFVVDANFFDIFSFKALKGDLETALDGPNRVVLTSETAKKYFGNENPIGKTLEMKGVILEGNESQTPPWESFEVTAVVSDPPQNSHMQFDLLSSMSSYPVIKSLETTWSWTAFINYGLVKKHTDLDGLAAKMQEVPKKHAAPTLQNLFNLTFDELEAKGNSWNLYLQPLNEVYLDAAKNNLAGPLGNRGQINIFTCVGIIILVLSCINFMNLSTARATKRSREVGMRKILGSNRSLLIRQFIFEAVIYALLSMVIAVLATELLLPLFNSIAGKELNLYNELSSASFLFGLVGSTVILGVISGIYPALYLTSFKPTDVLKGKGRQARHGKALRNALVIFQFVASVVLIIGTFFVHKQLQYTANLDKGYDTEHVLQLHNIELLNHEVASLKTRLMDNPAVTLIGQSHEVPPNIYRGDILTVTAPEKKELQVQRMKLDADYLNMLEPEFLAGRNFNSTSTAEKHTGVLLNATAVKELGWGLPEDYATDSPIGKILPSGRNQDFVVIGVVQDFHMKNAVHELMPLIIYHIENPFLPDSGTSPSYLSLKLNASSVQSPEDLSSLISEIQSRLSTLDESYPFEYSFMDQAFEYSYRDQQRLGQVLNVFTVLAVIIACLGLFGLAAFSAEMRIKELGIRKVLGAHTLNLIVTFSSEFTRLVFISLLIAIPLAYYLVDYWLRGFAYKTPLDLWVFVLAGAIAMIISWLTIGSQSFKVASENPIKALNNE